MESTFFLRVEIIIFFISLTYMIYYFFHNLWNIFSFFNRLLWNKQRRATQQVTETSNIEESDEWITDEMSYVADEVNNTLSIEDKAKITDILRKESIYYERGDYVTAKNLIVEWLALDKHNRLLNIELANIYNKEWEFKKSEYIYRELIENQKDDFELLKKLGFVLALQKKYKDSIRVYKEAHEKKPNDLSVIEILSDLTYELKEYNSSLYYLNAFLKNKPRDIEKLTTKAYCLDWLNQTEKAIVVYKKILEVQPYNTEIIDRVKELETS